MSFLDDYRKEQKIEKPEVTTKHEVREQSGGDRHDGVDVHGEEQCGESLQKERQAKRVYNNAYRNKNRTRINAQRKRFDQTPQGAYNKCRRRATGKGQKWDISLENWVHVWSSCPKIYDDQVGEYRLAWSMRGNDIQQNTQMRRKDVSKGWHVNNVEIIYRNQPIPAHGILPEWDWGRKEPSV